VLVAVVIQHAMRMRRIVICGLSGSKFNYILSNKRHDIRKNLLNIKYVFWFPLKLLSGAVLILRRTERDVIKDIYRSCCKEPIILARLYWNSNFLNRFSKNTQILNLMKIRPVGTDVPCGQTDRQTHMTKLIVAFCSFENALKNTERQTRNKEDWSARFVFPL